MSRTIQQALVLIALALTSTQTFSQVALSAADVSRIINQAAAQAKAQGQPATIAVVDRVGNRLGIFKMEGARGTVTVTSKRGVSGGLEGFVAPAELAAISKAITPAYFSTSGNAFTTRTANQLIQEHFNPGEFNQPAGPLYGVQFSQLSCSDVIVQPGGGSQGPKPAPLGLAADPGGLPLYKGGEIVGGIGITGDGTYGVDRTISDIDRDVDELIALAGTIGFEAPSGIRANRIKADGKTLRFTDVDISDLAPIPADAPKPAGTFLSPVRGGVALGKSASGIVPDGGKFYPGLDAFRLGARFNPRAGTEGAGALTGKEVRQILASGLKIAADTRAQLRNPASSGARVSIAISDTNGVALGIVRSRDAPVSSTDIALQKARTASLFSRPDAGAIISGAGFGGYVTRLRKFGLPSALSDGVAWSGRALQNLARPFFPDGIDNNGPGPFSPSFPKSSPFKIGLQLDVVKARILNAGGGCGAIKQFANGIQLRVTSVPIYRGKQVVGAVGISGDGSEQEDFIAFLAIDQAGSILGSINNADPAIRADTLTPKGVRLRYVACPPKSLLSSSNFSLCNDR